MKKKLSPAFLVLANHHCLSQRISKEFSKTFCISQGLSETNKAQDRLVHRIQFGLSFDQELFRGLQQLQRFKIFKPF
jgi:hypothetical protein